MAQPSLTARRAPRKRLALAAMAASCLALPIRAQQSPSSQGGPLPESESFYAATKENLARSQREASRFAYVERRTELHTNPFGRLGTGGISAFEVIPSADGKSLTRRLIERDGVAVKDEPPVRQQVRERRPSEGRRSAVEDAAAVLEFTIDRREILDGRPAIVVTFTPKADARPETRQGTIARQFAGTIWVDEAAREVVRVDATAVGDLTLGYGLVARLQKGATATMRRERVDGTTWLPTALNLTGTGRALLLRKLTIKHAIEWLHYRRVAG
jgi:hypothetical protein